MPDSLKRLLVDRLQQHFCLTGSCVPSYDHLLPISCSHPMHTGQCTAGQVPTNMESRVICIARRHPLYLVTPVLLRHAPTA